MTHRRTIARIAFVFAFLICAQLYAAENPHTVKVKFVPDEKPASNGASFMDLTPGPGPGQGPFMMAHAGLGETFPVCENGQTFFDVALISGDNDKLVVEVRTKDGAKKFEIPHGKSVTVPMAGFDYDIYFPQTEVNPNVKATSNQAMIIVTRKPKTS